ncbi:PAS domain S-box protein [Lutibacter holmesii]|uniref:histidine kinase n=1 Tax=Lutibacter holmesii TaxID=1137985 RepID=A0ABW3WLU1_9FLAO
MEENNTIKSNMSEMNYDAQNYFGFFEYAPIALYIEDFSEVKIFIDKKAKEANLDVENFLLKNKSIVDRLHEKVIIKAVNATAVKLYKAKDKRDLLANLDKVFTVDSSKGFSKLVRDILTGKKETVVETVNKTLEGDVLNIIIKYRVELGSEETLKNVIVSIEDITERVKAKNALIISEKRYKEAQEIAKLSSWFYDFELGELNWSDEVFSMVGMAPNLSLLSLNFYLSFIHKDDIALVNNFSLDYLINNPNQNLTYRIFTKQGELKYVYEKRSVIISNGKVQRVVGICQDVTERVLSEKKLNKTKKILSNTLSSIQDGFVILDKNSNYLYLNSIACKLLGKNEAELIGKNIWSEFHEKEGDLFYDNYQKALETKKAISFENYFQPWGRWFENRIIPSSDTMLMFFHEITSQKENENKVKAAYNIINKSSSVAILCENSWDFPIVFASENSDKLFGYTDTELLSGKVKIIELVYPPDVDFIRTYFFQLLKGEVASEKVKPKKTFRVVTKTGEIKWIETSIEVIKDDKGKVTHIQGITSDITERKKTEDLFFKSNQRLKDQFNNTPLASIMWDVNYKVIEWNNSAERIFGYSAEEVIGESIKDLLTPPHLKHEMSVLRETLFTNNQSLKNTNENITKSGKIITCDWYSVTLKDALNNVIGTACFVDDITDRILSKTLLKKSEKKYKDLFEKSGDAVFILKNGNFVDCNVATLKLFGYSDKASLVKVHPSEISPKIQPGGESSFLKAEEMMRLALENGSERFVWYHKKKNGTVFPTEVSLTKIGEDKNDITIHALVRDISERVKKEELEKILYNISNAAIRIEDFVEFGYFIRHELSKIIDTRNFYIALYNEKNDSFHTPVIVDEIEATTDFPAKKSLTGYVFKSKKSMLFTNESHAKLVESGEVGLIGNDSRIWAGVPLKTQDKVFGVIVVQSYENVDAYTEKDLSLLEFVADQISIAILRKNTENELKLALAKAQESDRLKSSFLANMSHEIRTPMNGIIGFSELFLNPELSYAERKEYAKIVINSSKQLLSIVNDILDISKIEAGVVKLNYENVNVNELLHNLETFYAPKAKKSNLKLTCVKGLKNSESNIKIDKTKLNQVITNLVSNAFKFTNKGSIEFGYELIDGFLRFYVKDTGVGIDKKQHDVIFDRFIQVDEDYSKQSKGTGLGLAISKRFVELFKGEIWLNSSKEGTTIFFTVPYTKVKETIVRSVVDKKVKIVESNIEISILVAEDEEYNLLYINELFSKTNYKVIEAENGLEAVEMAKKHPEIKLILMDIKMPIMNGIEAMKEIKQIRPNIPIVALSAFAMESDKENALENGFDGYVSKPIDKKILFDLIQEFTN